MNIINKEIFKRYEIRKTKKQKYAFRRFISDRMESIGYKTKVEKGTFGSKNLIVGNPESAKVIFTAHYDTCPILPFPNFITPKSIFLYILYQLILTGFILIPSILLGVLMIIVGAVISVAGGDGATLDIIASFVPTVMYFGLIGTLALMLFGPANKHTANDNTSGVTTLVDIMVNMPTELRDTAAFIFFDNEELGLLGSSSYAKAHPDIMREKLLINFDCVSDGENMLFALRRGAKEYMELIKEAYPSTESLSVEVLTEGVFYPSDQYCFKKGVGVAALNRSNMLGTLYLSRIHTRRDTIYKEENVSYLSSASVSLVRMLGGSENDESTVEQS